MPVNPLDSKISHDFLRKLVIPLAQGGGGGGSSNSLYSPTGEPQAFVENTHNTIPRCHHIRVDGRQCGCPSLRGKRLCYFHSRYRTLRRPQGLPLLEDPNSIQLMLMQVMRGLMEKSFDQKTAGLLFYALQTAMANGRRADFDPFPWDVVRDLHGAIPHDANQQEARAVENTLEEEEVAAEEPEEELRPFRAKQYRNARGALLTRRPPRKKQPKSTEQAQSPTASVSPQTSQLGTRDPGLGMRGPNAECRVPNANRSSLQDDTEKAERSG